MICSVEQEFNVYKLYGCDTQKKVNTSVKSLIKHLLINFNDIIILPTKIQ